MKTNPEWTVFIIFTSTITVYSYILRIFELPYYRQVEHGEDSYRAFDSYFNSVWCVIITMSTVGYGDISPSTTPGKCMGIIMALSGSFLFSLVVVTVAKIFDLEYNQHMAVRHIRITRAAAVTISSSIKHFLEKRKYYILKNSRNP